MSFEMPPVPTPAPTPAPSRPPKEALCYQCALRMSILFQYTAPPSLNQLLDTETGMAQASGNAECGADPVCDDNSHARFTIVHETPSSVLRYLQGLRQAAPQGKAEVVTAAAAAAAVGSGVGDSRAEVSATPAGEGKGSSCIDGMFGGENAPRHDVSWLCVACFGLYQFMDLVHAPAIAADVRKSPFSDSTALSVNVNVNRSFTFTWLAAATRYFDRAGTMTERPRATAVVPEELSNFKEFYMSDLRARVLHYLLRPHAEVVAAVQESKLTPGMATYLRCLQAQGEEGEEADVEGEPCRKCPRAEKKSSTSGGGGGAGVAAPPTAQSFVYNAESEKLVCEAYCRHHPTEQMLIRELIPQQYCRNKVGCVLTYSVVYDYAVPFLTSKGWAAPADRDTRTEKREAATVSCGITHANIYLMGNYRKMMRNLSQSPWFADGVRVGSYSLQEIIANPVLPFFFPEDMAAPTALQSGFTGGSAGGEAAVGAPAPPRKGVSPSLISAEQVFGHGRYKFHSAGREDVDVRMLGTGRPFVLEIVNPTREQFQESDLRDMERAINESYSGSVEVFNLRLTDANITVRLARHSESKIKRYRCVIWSSRAITDLQNDPFVQRVNATVDLQVEQKTPLRVLHRRSLHARPRTIHSMALTPLSAHWLILEAETQAGTYVKEFVHGDMGRTTPNMGVLLNSRTDIVQLDVVGMAIQDLDAVPQSVKPGDAAAAAV